MKPYLIVDQITIPGIPGVAVVYRKEQGVTYSENSRRGADGKLILTPHPLEYSRTELRSTFAILKDGYGNPLGLATAQVDYPAELPSVIEDLRANAVSKFYSKAASVQANIAEMYKTRAQTIDMVTNMVRRLANGYLALKRRNIREFCNIMGVSYKKPKRGHTNPPELWLEYNYGWKPLIQDVYTILNNGFSVPDVHLSATTRFTRRYELDLPGDTHTKYVYDINVKCRQSGYVRVSGAAIQAISQYGINNPALLAWELLPFSFVVDWMLPIGNYLELLGATAGLEFTNCSQGLSYETITNSSTTYKANAYMIVDPPFVQGKQTRLHYVRSVGTPTIPLPMVKNPLSFLHFSEAMSLLATAFGRRK